MNEPQAITLHGHFDGVQIQLDEPFDLPMNARLLITVIQSTEDEKRAWLLLSRQGLASAYGNDEPEYNLMQVKEPNATYEAG